MPKMKLWRNNKTNDYKFTDRAINEYFEISGTQVFVHRYMGTLDQDGNLQEDIKIQDLLFMESRDRKYDEDVIETYAVYTVSDNDFELSQFGFFQADTLYLDFHLNTTVQRLGRKLSAGDVIELSHLRDDLLEGVEGAVNAYYVVEEGRRSAEGYGATWLPHIWRVRIRKIFDSREYSDILGTNEAEEDDDGLQDLISNYNRLVDVNEGVTAEAEEEVAGADENYDPIYNEAYDKALPFDENLNLDDIQSVTMFPVDAEDGDYVIRVDYRPHQLFKRVGNTWKLVDKEILREWVRGHEHTESFVENKKEFTDDEGETRQERTYITDPVKPIIDDEDEN